MALAQLNKYHHQSGKQQANYLKAAQEMGLGRRYRLEIPEPAPSLSQHGASIGGIWVFPTIKITVTHLVHMNWGLSVKINTCETPHCARRLWVCFVCVCFRVCGRQKTLIPPTEAPMADNAITRGV